MTGARIVFALAFAAAFALPAAAHRAHREPAPDQARAAAPYLANVGGAAGMVRVRAPRAVQRELHARAIAVDDGDSFVARTPDGEKIRVRLAGIDAPEKSQPWADRAREKLRAVLGGQPLTIRPAKTDRWGRFVALVQAGDQDASLEMLQAGLAWHYARYDSDLPPVLRERYAEAAAQAREARIGLWRARDPEPPWEFRRRSPRR